MEKAYTLKNSMVVETATEKVIPVVAGYKKRAFVNFLNGGGGFNGFTPNFFLIDMTEFREKIALDNAEPE